ncbi:MAG: hypothetical protein ACXWP1_09925 [Bdellovibrionota bacterium]
MKFLSLASLCALLCLAGCSKPHDSNPPAAAAPSSWTTLPEAGGSTSYEEPSSEFTKAVESKLSTSSLALEAASPEKPRAGKWHLGGMMANFGLSVGGIFGFIGAAGTTSLEVIWTRTLNQRAKHAAQAALKISPNSSELELRGRLEPMIKVAAASGRFPDNENVRNGLFARALGFRKLCAALARVRAPNKFHASELRLEIDIDASGQITPVIAAGGSVALRFDWDFDDPVPGVEARPATAFEKSLASLVNGLSQDIAGAVARYPSLEGSPYELKQVKFSLGISESGDIAIATEDSAIIGTVEFERADELPEISPASPAGNVRILNAKKSQNPATLAFAAANGITHNADTFVIPHEKLRNGLARAVRIGAYFGKRAKAAESATWKIIEISPEFDLSIGGTLGLKTIAGTAGIELTFGPKGNDT